MFSLNKNTTKHLVIIGMVIPEPASTAAGKRMLQLMDIFKDWGYTITFLSAAQNLEFSEKIAVQKIEINHPDFDLLIKKLNPDIVLFDRYITEEQFGWRVSENCPNAVKILDTEDLHFLREARRKAFYEKRELEDHDLINEIFKREIASILRCDLSLIISEYEYQLLVKKFSINSDILCYIPFLFDGKITKNTGFLTRNHFVSIGNFLHLPNWQTVVQLRAIWKKIRATIPQSELHIYGAYTSEKVWQLHDEKAGFIIKGRANSVEDVFSQYRVMLAPIPFGAGLKGKIFESMLFGLPNVTSSIGAEGFGNALPWNGFVENDEADFIQKSTELYSDKICWEKAQHNGYEILNKNFNKKDFQIQFQERLTTIRNDLPKHRDRNYLGQILHHHTLQSTKYLSKWIEQKKN